MYPKFAGWGLDLQSELNTVQFVIPAGAGATFTAANNVGTITFNAAHGLTMVPAAGKLPNYFIGFGGSTAGLAGTGILVGNVFRILSIPSTTAITIYTTITAATVTSLTGLPVFLPPFIGGAATIGPLGPPTQTIAAIVTGEPWPLVGSVSANFFLGANCDLFYYPDNTFIPLGPDTGNTLIVAPTARKLLAASAAGQFTASAASIALIADGTTATSFLSVYN